MTHKKTTGRVSRTTTTPKLRKPRRTRRLSMLGRLHKLCKVATRAIISFWKRNCLIGKVMLTIIIVMIAIRLFTIGVG